MGIEVTSAGVCDVDELAGLDDGRDQVHLMSSMMALIVNECACPLPDIDTNTQQSNGGGGRGSSCRLDSEVLSN